MYISYPINPANSDFVMRRGTSDKITMNRSPSDEHDESPKTTETRRAVISRRSLLLTGGTLGVATPGLSLRALGSRGQRDEQHEDEHHTINPSTDSLQDTRQASYLQKLTPSDGDDNNFFGYSVAISGNTALIGASWDDERGERSGSAYVFRFDGCQWVEEQKLTASDGTTDDGFGTSVAISGNTAIVGASWDDDNGDYSGSAYVFRFDGCQWTEKQKLTASDGTAYDTFGASVAISDDVALIGAADDYDNKNKSGSVYGFQFDGSQWTEEQKLSPYDGTAYDGFGHRVAISDDVALIGAYADDDNGKNSGAAYVFRFDGSQWTEEQKLTASDGADYDKFGVSVAVSADVAFISAYGSDKGDTLGSAYVFRFDGSQWVEEQNLTASDGTAGDKFAHTIAVSDNVALIGAYGDDDSGTDSGSAYVFRFDGSQWTEEQKLTSSEEIAYDWFGASVAISDDVALIGAFRDHDNGNNSGAAYVFNL